MFFHLFNEFFSSMPCRISLLNQNSQRARGHVWSGAPGIDVIVDREVNYLVNFPYFHVSPQSIPSLKSCQSAPTPTQLFHCMSTHGSLFILEWISVNCVFRTNPFPNTSSPHLPGWIKIPCSHAGVCLHKAPCGQPDRTEAQGGQTGSDPLLLHLILA